jgi:outer membrane immunogenic protein
LTAIAALSAPAFAADMPMAVKSRPVVAPVADWSGIYLGISAGGVWGRNEWSSDETSPFTPGAYDTTGWTVGGILGANVQIQRTVVGVEFDGNWADVTGSKAIGTPFGLFTPNISSIDNRIDWTAHARARVGYSFGSWMPFIAGGAAFAGVRDRLNFITPVTNFGVTYPGYSDSRARVGFTIGGGVDWKVMPNFIVRAEYLYDNYGNTVGRQSTSTFNTETFSLDTHTVRGALIYQFANY